MTMIYEATKEKLEQLKDMLSSGAVHSIVKREGYHRITVVGEKENSRLLPTLTGKIGTVDITIDVFPYPEGGFLFNIEAKVQCPFKLTLTHENREIKSLKFKGGSLLPVQEIEIGHQDFDDLYFIETLEEKPVREFLETEENRRLIMDLGDFDRFVFQYKHLKIVYYIESIEKLDLEWAKEKIKILAKLETNLSKLMC